MQQQVLRPGREGVVAHQQQPRPARPPGHPRHRPAGGVQEGGAEMPVRLQIGALGPLVPGIDADERLAEERSRGRPRHQLGQPVLVGRRGGAMHHQPGALAAGIVVPAGDRGFDQREIRRRLVQRGGDHVGIGEHLGGGARIEIAQLMVARRRAADQLVRRKLDGAVEAEFRRIGGVEALRHHQHRVLAMVAAEQPAPARHGGAGVGDQPGAVDHQHRAAGDADIARVAEMPGQAVHQRPLVAAPPVLRDQHLLVRAVPAAGPVLVRPHQAEREIQRGLGQHRLDRVVEQAAAVEPVEIMHEAEQPGIARQLDLPAHGLRVGQRIMAEVARDARLVMPGEARHGAGDRRPFGESGAPPGIVLGHRMELRQVIGQNLGPPRGGAGQRHHLLEARAGAGGTAHLLEDIDVGFGRNRMQAQQVAGAAIVQQRVFRQVGVQVAAQVVFGVEPGGGVAPLAIAPVQVMLERVHPGGGDVGVAR